MEGGNNIDFRITLTNEVDNTDHCSQLCFEISHENY